MKKRLMGAAAAVALLACQPSFATEAGTEQLPVAQQPGYYHMPGPDLAADGSITPAGFGMTYLFLAGSAFTPRSSNQTITYPGAGCTKSSSDYVVASLELPENTEVYGIRLYYYNNGSTGSVSGALTSYTGDGGSQDLIFGTSTQNTGYVSEYFAATSLTIDNYSQSYSLLGKTDVGLALCGIRVFHSS